MRRIGVVGTDGQTYVLIYDEEEVANDGSAGNVYRDSR